MANQEDLVAIDKIFWPLENFIEIDLSKWLLWLSTPVLFTFLAPLFLLFMLYLSALIFFIYGQRINFSKIKDASERKHYWNKALNAVMVLWDIYGCLWYGYEVIGFENIPHEGPALIIIYHGLFPLDLYFLRAKCVLYKKRMMSSVVDHFLFRIPGWKLLLEMFHMIPGSIDSCINILRGGELLNIYPGGTREAIYSDENYGLFWGQRMGFAKVAIGAQVPIIPAYTQNIQEAFRTIKIGKNFFRNIYEWTRLPIVPFYGGFPVKLRTIIGKPIEFDPTVSAEELTQRTSLAIEELIRKNQRIPGSIPKAIIDRFYCYPKQKHN